MYPIPFNDPQRLAVLRSYGLLDTPPEEDFDRLTRLACQLCNTPVALISLVDEHRQWFKSKQGLDAPETHRELAFCGHAILSDTPLIVLDAEQDSRFAGNALVCDEPGIRFYAGAPLIDREGFRLGTVCAIDFQPRESIGEDEITALQDLAALAMRLFEERKQRLSAEEQVKASDTLADAQTELFSMIAHEVRSPLSAINTGAEFLNNENAGDDAQQQNLIGMLAGQSEHALEVVERMLKYGRLHTGDVPLKEQEFPLANLFDHLRQGTFSTPGQTPPAIDLVDPGATLNMYADPTVMRQILNNLVTNAVRYSDAPAQVRVSAERNQDGTLTIAVADEGVGMDQAGIARALQPYTRLEGAKERAHSGMGLGLPLVKRFTELHGGELGIESSPGRGTTVRVTLPSHRVRTAEAAQRQQSARPGAAFSG